MILYTACAFLFYRLKENEQRVELIIFIIIFSIALLFRNENVPDYSGYVNGYININPNHNYGFSLWNRYYELGYEYGYVWLMVIIKKIFGNNPNYFFFIISLITSLISMYSIRSIVSSIRTNDDNFALVKKNIVIVRNTEKIEHFTDFPLMFVLFVSYYGFSYEAVAIRSGLSMAFMLLALAFIIKKRYFSFFLSVIMAISIHRIAIITILIYLIFKFMPKIDIKAIKITWAVLGILIFFRNFTIVQVLGIRIVSWFLSKFPWLRYDHYLEGASSGGNISRTLIFTWLIGWLFIYFIYNEKNLYHLFNVYGIGVTLSLLVSGIAGSARLSDYLVVFSIPLFHEFYTQANQLTIATRRIMIMVVIVINTIICMRIWTSV